MNNNIILQDYHITREKRCRMNGHQSLVIWFTGLSGSGKSTIANELEKELFRRGIHTYSLDGDNIRTGLNQDLGFSENNRHENIRRIAEVGKLFVDAGILTISAFISPLEQDRQMARKIIGKENFLEIFVNTPLEICEKRDVKGLYKKARAGEIKNFTGIDALFEYPANPDIELKTQEESKEKSVQRIVQVLEEKLGLNYE